MQLTSANVSVNGNTLPTALPTLAPVRANRSAPLTLSTAAYETKNDSAGRAVLRTVAEGDPAPTATAIEAAMATAPAAIVADIAVVDGGIKVGRRETLDYVIGLIEAGALPTSPLVAWIGSDGNARPPARIIADGDRFKAGG